MVDIYLPGNTFISESDLKSALGLIPDDINMGADTIMGRLATNGAGQNLTPAEVLGLLSVDTIAGNDTRYAPISVTQYTDEMAQDAVGGILTDSSEIDFTYDDAANTITAGIVTGSIDVLKLDAGVQASLGLADSASQPGHTHDVVIATKLSNTSTSTTASEVIGTLALPAGQLGVAGDSVEVHFSGSSAANTNDKYAAIKFDGNAIVSLDAFAQSGADWCLRAIFTRVSATEVRYEAMGIAGTATYAAAAGAITGLTLGSSLNIEAECRSPSAAGEITCEYGIAKMVSAS